MVARQSLESELRPPPCSQLARFRFLTLRSEMDHRPHPFLRGFCSNLVAAGQPLLVLVGFQGIVLDSEGGIKFETKILRLQTPRSTSRVAPVLAG
ncbi:MAG: hypothetical protein JWO19_1763 [Bryobacterales bacterium]|nr:hypothetical protein [Bryobacterales bacterium]